MVASKAMGSGSTASGGEGFNDLAGFIGGRNESGARMEMTTPVFTSGGEGDKSMR